MQISDLVFIDAAGYHYSDYPTFLSWVKGEYQRIYGADTYLGPDSQDGQWVAILAQAFFDTAKLGSSSYNSFSPATAQGVGLARNVKINGMLKRVATHSTVELDIVGVNGTALIDCIAVDILQQQWSIPPTTIPFSGTITVTATAISKGAIAALADTITGIFTPTQGWQTVNNAADATVGQPVETDAQLRARQKNSVANPSLTVFEGTVGAVANTMGVTAVQGYENATGSTDGNGLPAHSVAVVASGGLDADVAAAIQVHKTPGTRTFGTTAVTVDDSHGMPIAISFYRPTNATIGVQVTIVELAGWSPDTIALIQKAVSDYVLSIPIGGSVIITKLYVIAYLVGMDAYGTFNIVSIQVKKNAGSFGSSNIVLAFNEITVCNPSTNVSVVT